MTRTLVALAATATALSAAVARPAPPPDGRALFQTHCAVCHGPTARGDGPWAALLAYRPPDLTRLGARSRSDFPEERVREIIDGRRRVKGHMPAEMPVWGDVLRTSEVGYSEKAVRDRIAALTEYLRTLQTEK